MTILNLNTFEIITAITTTYKEDIEKWLLEEDGEILQIEVAEMVMSLFNAYQEDTTNESILSLINNKHISIDEVV